MLSISFDPFPELTTERLLLRRIKSDDAAAIYKLRSDPQTMRFVPRPLAQSIDDAHGHIRMIDEKIESNTGINWAISMHDNADFLGIIGLFKLMPEHFRAEIGYMLLPEFHNKGIVSEALDRVAQYGFNDLKLHSIEAIIDPRNVASERVLEKNGFRKEAHLRENEFYNEEFLDTVIYCKLKTD